jgi:hypothetical protein
LDYALRVDGGTPFNFNSLTTIHISVPADKKLVVSVENMWCGEKEHPLVELAF